MKITYLKHSGFVVEYQDIVLIFDYYGGQMPPVSDEKKVYVFVSHAHSDHFRRDIFKWETAYKNIQYILSNDIQVKGPKGKTTYVGPHREIRADELKIMTLRSTDEGVAFFICLREKNIYHAGDLNWWHWEEETDEYNEKMRREYCQEIGLMEGRHIDVAFVPLDPRQGEQYGWGLDYFMRHTDTAYVFPMHMWDQYEIYDKLMRNPDAEPYRDRVMRVTRPQQVFEL